MADVPEFDYTLRSSEIRPTKGNKLPGGAFLMGAWSEVENGETVTRQRIRRADGSYYIRTVGADGFIRSWHEEDADGRAR